MRWARGTPLTPPATVADTNAWLRDFRTLTCLGRLSVAGLETSVGSGLAVATTLVIDDRQHGGMMQTLPP